MIIMIMIDVDDFDNFDMTIIWSGTEARREHDHDDDDDDDYDDYNHYLMTWQWFEQASRQDRNSSSAAGEKN